MIFEGFVIYKIFCQIKKQKVYFLEINIQFIFKLI